MILNQKQWLRSTVFSGHIESRLRKCYSVNYLISALESTERKEIEPISSSTQKKPHSKKLSPKDISKLLITPSRLNDIFRHDFYLKPTQRNIEVTQSMFKNAKFELEWTFDKYQDIPDIKYEILKHSRDELLKNVEKRTEFVETSLNSRKTFGINPNLLKPLPEILLLGHTNSGKSSLINTLFLKKRDSVNYDYNEYAYVSKKAGYTKTLNCYNVGNKFRIIDSPGYGMFGEEKQGEVVLEYISKRRLLRRVFIIIDGVRGFLEEDIQIINHLTDEGVPFEIVFTKIDQVINSFAPTKAINKLKKSKVSANLRSESASLIEKTNDKVIKYFNEMIDSINLRDLATLPRILFNNSMTNSYVDKRYGYKEIRYCILESCGLLIENSSLRNPEENEASENKRRRKTSVKYVSVKNS